MLTLVILLYPADAIAENTTTITPINDKVSLKKNCYSDEYP
jgi:hypothetical protein